MGIDDDSFGGNGVHYRYGYPGGAGYRAIASPVLAPAVGVQTMDKSCERASLQDGQFGLGDAK
jgi:hypothetical protein